MIESDIKSYFDNIDYLALAKTLEEKIKDKNIMDLYWKMVKAGYINQGKYEPSGLTGVPHGGVLSPLLSNIYLHVFDEYMMQLVTHYTPTGKKRIRGKQPAVYTKTIKTATKIKKQLKKAEVHEKKELILELKKVNKERITLSSRLLTEETNRLYYVRYADD